MPSFPAVTCLGCGCACDDIEVTVAAGRIVGAAHACALGVAWFGDGRAPADARIGDRRVALDEAVRAAAALIRAAKRPLVVLAPGLSCEAQREAVALADATRASLDTITSHTSLGAILAAQERGRASATLGEMRRRADVVVWWGVDPDARHPRFSSRYAPRPASESASAASGPLTVIAVDIDTCRAGPSADRRFAVPAEDEIATLTAVRAIVEGAGVRETPSAGAHTGAAAAAIWARARLLAEALAVSRYVSIVADAERVIGGTTAAQTARWSALIALAQALNTPTRCALTLLRGGGNVSGADAVLTSQTGYPLAVDFSRGVPRYRPHDGTVSALASGGHIDAALVIGAAGALPPAVATTLATMPVAVVGPGASASRPAPHQIAIDTGLAGVHEAGTALRLDDVPLPLTAVVAGPPAAAAIVKAIREAVLEAGHVTNGAVG